MDSLHFVRVVARGMCKAPQNILMYLKTHNSGVMGWLKWLKKMNLMNLTIFSIKIFHLLCCAIFNSTCAAATA